MNIDYISMIKHSHMAKRKIQDCDCAVEQLEKTRAVIEKHYGDYIESLKKVIKEQRADVADNMEELTF